MSYDESGQIICDGDDGGDDKLDKFILSISANKFRAETCSYNRDGKFFFF